MTKTALSLKDITKRITFQWQRSKQIPSYDLYKEFDILMKHAKKHRHNGSEEITFQQKVISILIEQEKEINRLIYKLKPSFRKKCPRCYTERDEEEFRGALCPDCREYLFFHLPKYDKQD